MPFTLTKLSVEPDKDSLVTVGYSTTTKTAKILDLEYSEDLIDIASLDDVKVGLHVFLLDRFRYHNTSAIKEIISRDANKIVFKTQTSIYELKHEIE